MKTTQNLPASTLTKSQKKQFGPRIYTEGGTTYRITAKVRHDDQCGNGHNSFSITADIDRKAGNSWRQYSGGCCHEEVVKHFPQLAPLLKWHLTSADGPMHYVSNTLYWLGFCNSQWCDGNPGSPPRIDYARSAAVWPDMPESYLANNSKGPVKDDIESQLANRLPALMAEFKAAVESLGFTY